MNGDGFDDLIVGAYGVDVNDQQDAGATYVVFGSSAGLGTSFDLGSLNGSNGFVVNGADAQDYSGFGVESLGDVNGDGIDDFAIGTGRIGRFANNGPGEVYVIFGQSGGFSGSISTDDLDGTNGFVISVETGTGVTGTFLSSGGDFNGDGLADILIGSPFTSVGADTDIGEAYLVYGSTSQFSSGISTSDLDGSNGFVIRGADGRHEAGFSVANLGDVNGDGADDIGIGSPGASPDDVNSAGTATVVFGIPSAVSSGDAATVSIIVEGVNDAPVAEDDEVTFSESETATGNLLQNDSDVDRQDELRITQIKYDVIVGRVDVLQVTDDTPAVLTLDSNVTVLVRADGSFEFTYTIDDSAAAEPLVLRPGDVLTDSFSYTISDPNGGSAQGTVSIRVNGDADPIIQGTPSDNTLNGTDADEDIRGLGGDDTINAGAGDDTIDCGNGNDTCEGGLGSDFINGGGGNDFLDGGADNDEIFGGRSRDQIFGGDGDDMLSGQRGSDLIDGGAGDDTIFGNGLADTIFDGEGDDMVMCGGGNDSCEGGLGDDMIFGGGGDDFLDGGLGVDVIVGGRGNDTINGVAGVDVINAGAGDDMIFVDGFDESELGDSASDLEAFIRGGAGDDTIVFGDQAAMSGNAGADIFTPSADFVSATAQINDFTIGEDKLDLSNLCGADSIQIGETVDGFAQILIASSDGDTSTIILQGITQADAISSIDDILLGGL